jgi:hypothetical protein
VADQLLLSGGDPRLIRKLPQVKGDVVEDAELGLDINVCNLSM